MKWVPVILLFVTIQYGCVQESARTESAGVSLTVGPASLDYDDGPGFYLETSNQSAGRVILYEQALIPQLSVHVCDRAGNHVPKLPPPMPERPGSRRAIILMPGKSHRQTFALRHILATRILESGEYTLEAVYDASGLPADASLLTGPFRSNKIEFSFP